MWRPKSKPKDLEVRKSERPDKVDLRLLVVTLAPDVGLRHLKVPEAPNGGLRLLIVTVAQVLQQLSDDEYFDDVDSDRDSLYQPNDV